MRYLKGSDAEDKKIKAFAASRIDTERRLIPEFKSLSGLSMITAEKMDERIFVTLSDKMFQMSRI